MREFSGVMDTPDLGHTNTCFVKICRMLHLRYAFHYVDSHHHHQSKQILNYNNMQAENLG